MRVVIQRVSEASVTVEGKMISFIGRGLLVLVGIESCDNESDIEWLTAKIAGLRIFTDLDDKMNLGVCDIAGDILVISQFTLHASTKKGNRPSFLKAASPEIAEPLYRRFCEALETKLGKPVGRGIFGADMKVALINDGPVTILIDSQSRE
jgi:D-tyrosyl-tRNA(Tyr) deacylase